MSTKSSNRFNHRGVLAAVIGVLGILGAPREKVWANDVTFRETVYNTDFVSAGVGGLRDATSARISLTGVSGTVNRAYLYWHGPMNPTSASANATIKVNGVSVTGVNIGFSDDNCWGFDNSQAYRADATALVRTTRNGSYDLTQFVKQGTNINANGASLLVFFNDSNPDNNRDIVLFDGNDSNAANRYDSPGWNVVLRDINYTSGRAFIQVHVSDGQIYPDDSVLLNGTALQGKGSLFQGTSVPTANTGPMGYGSLWDIKTWDITSKFNPGLNTLTLTHGYIGHDCISMIVAAINLPAGSAPPPPPANQPPAVTGVPEIVTHSPEPLVVQAQAVDADGNPLTATVAIDGTLVLTNVFPAAQPMTSGVISLTNSFGLGQHTVTFTATDGLASNSFVTVVKVIDNTPPVLHLPPNIVVPSDLGKTDAIVNYTVTATDDFPGVTVVSLPASGNVFPIGTTTVTATAVDSSGNRTQGSFTITVKDSLPPSVHCPADVLRSADPGSTNAVVYYTVPSSDNMPGMALTCTPPSGSTFPIGITTVVCKAKDAAGNTATCLFRVTVVDTEAPKIAMPTNQVVVHADPSQCGAPVSFTVTASDNAPGVTLVCAPPSGSMFPLGNTTVTCIASDTAGNKSTNTLTVTVLDKEPPTLGTLPNLTVPASAGQNDAIATFKPTAIDNCSAVTVVCMPASGSRFPVGTTTVTCMATDAAGNTATGSFNVTVTPNGSGPVADTHPPTVTVPSDMVVPTDPGRSTAVVTFTVGVQDDQPGATVIATPPSGSSFPLGTTTVVVVGTDTSGNKTTKTFTVTVVDREKPVLTLPPNMTVPAGPGGTSAVVTFTVLATDNGPGVTVQCLPPSGSEFPVGLTTVTCTATDAAGNTTTGSFTITVTPPHDCCSNDTKPPVILCLTPSKKTLCVPNHQMVPVTLRVSAKDNCSTNLSCRIVSVTSNEPEDGVGSCHTGPDWRITGDLTVELRAERNARGRARLYTITVECKDAAGNAARRQTVVTVARGSGRGSNGNHKCEGSDKGSDKGRDCAGNTPGKKASEGSDCKS